MPQDKGEIMRERLKRRLNDAEMKPKLRDLEQQRGSQADAIIQVTHDAARKIYTLTLKNEPTHAFSSQTLNALGFREGDQYENVGSNNQGRIFTVKEAALDAAVAKTVSQPSPVALIRGEVGTLRLTARSVDGVVAVPAKNSEHAKRIAHKLEGALANINVNAIGAKSIVKNLKEMDEKGIEDDWSRPRSRVIAEYENRKIVSDCKVQIRELQGGRAVVILTEEQATALGVKQRQGGIEYPAAERSMSIMARMDPCRIEFELRPNPYQEAVAAKAVTIQKSGYKENKDREEVVIHAVDTLGAEALLFDLRKRHRDNPQGLPPRMNEPMSTETRKPMWELENSGSVYMSKEQAQSLGINVEKLTSFSLSTYDPLTPPGEAVAPPAKTGRKQG